MRLLHISASQAFMFPIKDCNRWVCLPTNVPFSQCICYHTEFLRTTTTSVIGALLPFNGTTKFPQTSLRRYSHFSYRPPMVSIYSSINGNNSTPSPFELMTNLWSSCQYLPFAVNSFRPPIILFITRINKTFIHIFSKNF